MLRFTEPEGSSTCSGFLQTCPALAWQLRDGWVRGYSSTPTELKLRGWRKRPSDTEGSRECVAQALANPARCGPLVWEPGGLASASQPKFTRTHFAYRHSMLLAVPSKSHKYSHRAEYNYGYYQYGCGDRWRSWCRHYATRKEVPLSIPADPSYLHLPFHSNVHREVHTSPYDPSRPRNMLWSHSVNAVTQVFGSSFLEFHNKSDLYSSLSGMVGKSIYRRNYYLTLRQRNGAWLYMRLENGSALTTLCLISWSTAMIRSWAAPIPYLITKPRMLNLYKLNRKQNNWI
jgi:hypothetical protein